MNWGRLPFPLMRKTLEKSDGRPQNHMRELKFAACDRERLGVSVHLDGAAGEPGFVRPRIHGPRGDDRVVPCFFPCEGL